MKGNLKDWHRIYRGELINSELKEMAFDKMIELSTTFDERFWLYTVTSRDDMLGGLFLLATTFADWRRIYDVVPRSTHSNILAKLALLATAFDEWSQICTLASNDSERALEWFALGKKLDLAKTPSEYLEVYKAIRDNTDLGRHILDRTAELALLEKIAEINASFDEWGRVRQNTAADGDPMEMLGFKKIIETAKTPSEWVEVYLLCFSRPWLLMHEHGLKESILEKIAETNAHFNEWDCAYQLVASRGDELTEILFEQMFKAATNHNEWRIVREACPKGDEKRRIFIIDKMIETATTLGEQIETFMCIQKGDRQKELAFNAVIERAGTLEDWTSVYVETTGDLKEIAAEKMIDLATTCEELSGVCKTIGGFERKDLRERALEKMAKQAKDINEWLLVYRCAPVNSEFRTLALSKLAEF